MKRTIIAWLTTPVSGYLVGYLIGSVIKPEPHPSWLTLGAVSGCVSAAIAPMLFLFVLMAFTVFSRREEEDQKRDLKRAWTCSVSSFILTICAAVLVASLLMKNA